MKRLTMVLATAMLMMFDVAARMMPDSTIQIVAYWQVGDKYEYLHEQSSKEINVQGDTTSNEYSSQIMEFEVIGHTDNSYQIKQSEMGAVYYFTNPPWNRLAA